MGCIYYRVVNTPREGKHCADMGRGNLPLNCTLKGWTMAYTTRSNNDWRTMVSKFEGKCRRCDTAFPAGTTIRWAAGKGAWHLNHECPAKDTGNIEPETGPKNAGTMTSKEITRRMLDLQAELKELQAKLDAMKEGKKAAKASKRDATIVAELGQL